MVYMIGQLADIVSALLMELGWAGTHFIHPLKMLYDSLTGPGRGERASL